MQINPPVNRLQGALPKVGIRPVIDGRRQGVRESMEAATMAMARAAAELITERVRHACGLPVECVIADACIGGIAEAAACEAKFEREGVGVSLTVARSWCYGYEVMDMHPTRPKAIWGFNGTERPGAVFLAAAMAAHANKRLPAFSIYGREVQDADDFSIPPDVAERIVQFIQAGLAVATMQGKTYVSMGNVSMGIVGSLVDQDFLQRYLGMRTDDRRYGGVRAADGARHLRPRRVRTRLPVGQALLHGGQGLQPARQAAYPRTERAHLAAEHPDGAHRP
jgi:L-fucose isomerase (EC 5.3.1.25)